MSSKIFAFSAPSPENLKSWIILSSQAPQPSSERGRGSRPESPGFASLEVQEHCTGSRDKHSTLSNLETLH